MDKIVIFRPNIELEAIARQSVEASREVDCAYFGNIGRNSGYFLLPIFLGSYLTNQSDDWMFDLQRGEAQPEEAGKRFSSYSGHLTILELEGAAG